MNTWTSADIPSQRDRTVLVSGTGGLGYETALALAAAGARIFLAGRNRVKGMASVAAIRQRVAAADVRFELLDLASLASVQACAGRIADQTRTLDLLVNNAGVMAPPERTLTEDGFELQWGTNYLGHFALTAHLLPLLRGAKAGARVVCLASLAHRRGRLDFDDLQAARSYRPWTSYGQSKLAMLMFALELQRRSDAHGWGLASMAAHPGYALTDLIENGPGKRGLLWQVNRLLQPLISQPAAAGAWPVLFAATSREVQGGGYYGPDGRLELRGHPATARIWPQALDEAAAARLWSISETLTGAPFAQATGQ